MHGRFGKITKVMAALLFLLVISISLLLFGCGKDRAGNEQKAGTVPSKEQGQVDVIRLGGGIGGIPARMLITREDPGSARWA